MSSTIPSGGGSASWLRSREDSRSLGLKQGDHVPVCSDLGMARDLKGPLFEGDNDSSARQTHTWISTKYQSMWISQKYPRPKREVNRPLSTIPAER